MTERLTCTDQHLPGCWNPTPRRAGESGCTACICGAMWWPGRVGVWKCTRRSLVTGETSTGRPIYEPGPWRVYFMHNLDCAQRDSEAGPDFDHLCRDLPAEDAATFWGRP